MYFACFGYPNWLLFFFFRYCFLHVFLLLIQKELDEFREQHNSHRIRNQKDRRVPNGVPDDLYLFPGVHGKYNFFKLGYFSSLTHSLLFAVFGHI